MVPSRRACTSCHAHGVDRGPRTRSTSSGWPLRIERCELGEASQPPPEESFSLLLQTCNYFLEGDPKQDKNYAHPQQDELRSQQGAEG